ncbi:MAG: hypothetical protein KDC53_03450 [Saprospiraceae bacterium]|nr:hypothetical protein [Saprospiraceae bacterium]
MEGQIARISFRFILLLLIQGLILHRVNLGGEDFNYVQIFVYPFFIMLLPVQTGRILLILLAFLIGISVDIFYDSPGLHASASVFTAFIRPFVLSAVEPRGGYKINSVPTKNQFGFNWFVRYISILLILHLFWYFSLEVFQISRILIVILKTIASFIASILFIGLYVVIFNPKN